MEDLSPDLTPFQGKVVLGETQREKVVEGLIESYRTMLQNHRTDAITAHCFRHIKSSKTFEYIKLIKDNCIDEGIGPC